MSRSILVLVLAAVAGVAACSSSSGGSGTACTPGASVACVGVGGCSGGQTCASDGSGYGACACGGNVDASANDGSVDAGANRDAAADAGGSDAPADVATPTLGAVHVIWSLQKMGSATTCANVAGAVGVGITVTKMGATTGQSDIYGCTAGSGDSLDLPFGVYSVAVDLLNAQSQSLGSAPTQVVTLAASPCDQIIHGDCVKNVSATITVN